MGIQENDHHHVVIYFRALNLFYHYKIYLNKLLTL